jgi:uncharacterized protein YigE (DUF2233 family)
LTVPASRTLLAVFAWLASSLTAHGACSTVEAEAQRYTACSYAAGDAALEIRNLDVNGEPYRYLGSLALGLAGSGRKLLFAMNAGMYDENQRPIGYYVEEGQQVKKLNRRNGSGNFHLKPNGVFYVKNGKPGVMETEAFARSGIKPDFASQSGPMLVINGKIHPKFSATGTSRKLRNGVGIDAAGRAYFVISEGAVTFWEFASLFRDQLKTDNALFFDGSVSSLYAPELGRNDGFLPLGPMVGAFEIK